MEDAIAYLILFVVIAWFVRHIYRKVTMQDNDGCGNGCENCGSAGPDCNVDPFNMNGKQR